MNNSRKSQAIAALLAGFSIGHIAFADVNVRFDPPAATVAVGSVVNINIVADIGEPVIAWGLDLEIENAAVLSLNGEPSIGPAWVAAYSQDGDGLAALAFPDSVSGTDIGWAPGSLSADAGGETDLLLSVTPGDVTEGFGLDPSGFAEVTFEPGHVAVTPEPATLSVLALGSLLITRRRR